MFKEIGVLSSIIENNDYFIYETMNGYLGVILKYHNIDLEVIEDEQVKKSFHYAFNSINSEVHLKWISETKKESNIDIQCSRKQSLSAQGYFKNINYLVIETKVRNRLFSNNEKTVVLKLIE